MTAEITEQELVEARQIWGSALVLISKEFEAEGIDAARGATNGMLDAAYGFELGQVLFKPTFACGKQTFRTTRDGALAYFLGHSAEYPEDAGFGIKGWRSVDSETAASFIHGDVAMWMGWVMCTDKNGDVTKVDKSWGYKKDEKGKLRIVLHHSSLPYQTE